MNGQQHESNSVLETKRLVVQRATPSDEDVELYYRLWTDPDVMTFVGFPRGIEVTREEIREGIARAESEASVFDTKLLVVLRETGERIGECKLGTPDENGIAMTDIKLLPCFWGRGFGSEIKQGLVDYLFASTDCRGVKATPHRDNVASQKMQEAVGAVRVTEDVYRFPEHMRSYTTDVPHFVYIVYRDVWEQQR